MHVETNEQGLGKAQRKALDFIRQVNGWHSYADDVRGVVLSLASRGLVEVSEKTKQFRAIFLMSCDSCQAAMINGIFCHETGCPNSRKKFVGGEWVKIRECFECGCEVIGDATCCEAEETEYCKFCGIAVLPGEDCLCEQNEDGEDTNEDGAESEDR